MFKAFNLEVSRDLFIGYEKQGEQITKQNNLAAQKGLDAFFDTDGSLFAHKIMDNWFPDVDSRVFISHSHKDEPIAVGLAGWLRAKFGISSFIDSCVWGYAPDLLKKFDDQFCMQLDGYYSYSKRNVTTGHVNMMLATSLTKMIDQCECIIFLNTPNSISCKGCIESDGTLSPWIYAEIEATRMLRVNLPERMRQLIKAGVFGMESNSRLFESLEVRYDLNLEHLRPLGPAEIMRWQECAKRGDDALDFLYDNFGV